MVDNNTARSFRVGFVNDNFPLLFTSHGGFRRGILNDIYLFFAQINGLKLQWVLVDEYGHLFDKDRFDTLSNILVFSPLMILFIAMTFAVSFLVEKVTHAVHLRLKNGNRDSFFSYLFGKAGQLDCNSNSSGSLLYRFIFARVLASAFIYMIYTSVFTGSTVFSVSKELNLLDMIGDIRRLQSRLIIEHPSFLNSAKTSAIFGMGYVFPSENVISNKKNFIDHLCQNAADYGKVNSFFLATVNPQQKTKYPCEIATIAPGKLQNQTSSIQNAVIQPSPYTLLLRKNEKTRLKKSLNAVIITIFQFEKISTIHWRRYTNRDLNLPKYDSSISSNIVKLPEIAFLFYALLVGFIISAIALLIEILISTNISKIILIEISKLYCY